MYNIMQVSRDIEIFVRLDVLKTLSLMDTDNTIRRLYKEIQSTNEHTHTDIEELYDYGWRGDEDENEK